MEDIALQSTMIRVIHRGCKKSISKFTKNKPLPIFQVTQTHNESLRRNFDPFSNEISQPNIFVKCFLTHEPYLKTLNPKVLSFRFLKILSLQATKKWRLKAYIVLMPRQNHTIIFLDRATIWSSYTVQYWTWSTNRTMSSPIRAMKFCKPKPPNC